MFVNFAAAMAYLAVGVWLVQYVVTGFRNRPLMADPAFLRMGLICIYITGVPLWPVYAVVFLAYVVWQVAKDMFQTLVLGGSLKPKHFIDTP